ncbi:amidase [Albidovulum sp.]|uniref:amidase n=1 Tax=Albidovulum sp. TaxID=1872424 RepID=UPI002D0E69C7|nr:amidase [Defluviimonas sp.]MCP5356451.1 amidase [Paracoccaceae bacterium]MCP5375541.1 amidase [Paracoccaceae bacterium]HPE26718.1 amidase [Albidovulum sp.]
MRDDELCYMPATEALARFRDKSLSPVELMAAVIARAEQTEPKLNAITYRHFDEAMDSARKAEARYAKGGRTRALEGLPVAIKDESYIKGKPTSNGSLILKDHVADHTSPVNERILRAGAIVHARTATPEFSCAGYCWSRLWGVTRNPWNTDFTPGGSSGGSGAVLAAGSTTLATGSDIGGSIRIPASLTGTVGYKPPYGRNPEEPPFNLDFYCHNGPMARTVRDTILMQNVMAGPHPRDISTLRPRLRLPSEMKPIKGWKIAYSMDLGLFEVDSEVQANTLAALDVFRSLGATVEEVDLGWPADALEAGLTYLRHIFGAYLGQLLADHADEMTDYARAFAETGMQSRAVDFVHSLEVAGQMYATLGPLLERYDLLICPTAAVPSVPAEFNQHTGSVKINGKEVNPMLGWVMTTPFNTLSRCPVLSVPSGHASNGVPTGIQLVGRTYSDADVFRAGLAYETAVGGWYGDASARPAP